MANKNDKKSTTKFWRFRGKVTYPQVYKPDEYLGKRYWKLNFFPDSAEEWDRIKQAGIQSRVKDDKEGNGKFITLKRDTVKEFKNGTTYFTPPFIFDTDGSDLVTYVDDDGKQIRAYTDKDAKIQRVGEPVLIGNGSLVYVNVSTYETASYGIGKRLESIQLLDLIAYEPPDDSKRVEGPEGEDDLPF